MMDPQYLKSQCTRKVLLPQMQEQSFSSKQDNANLVAPMKNQLQSTKNPKGRLTDACICIGLGQSQIFGWKERVACLLAHEGGADILDLLQRPVHRQADIQPVIS